MNAAGKLKHIRIVLCGTVHPGNIGSAARAMKTMGLERLYLVNPQRYPDPRAEWLASSAVDVLEAATICTSLDEALAGTAFAVGCTARTRELAVPMVTAREAAARVLEVAVLQDTALVFGNETAGLSGEEVSRCRLLATVPAHPGYPSLNLAAAVQVFAYELRQTALSPAAVPGLSPIRATHEQIEALFADFERTLIATGFLDPAHPKKLMPRLRRLFSRAALEEEEVNILRGVLRSFRTPRKR